MKNNKQMTTRKFIRVLTIAALMSMPVLTHAQDPNQGQNTSSFDPVPTDPPPPPPDPGAPIDGGLSLLIAAGAAYGVKKYRDGRKQKEDEMK